MREDHAAPSFAMSFIPWHNVRSSLALVYILMITVLGSYNCSCSALSAL